MSNLNVSDKNVLNKEEWAVDNSHSKIQFSARHMIIAEVTGHFNKFDIKASSGESFEDTNIEVEIDAGSVDTGIQDRDKHLKSPDFFDVEKYQKITFKSREFNKISDEKYKLIGDLKIRGISKPIELDVTYGGQINDPWGNVRAGFRISGSVNRFDYDLKWNALMETGGAVVGKTINFTCDVEMVKTKEEENKE